MANTMVKCCICGVETNKPVRDHNHRTGYVRGLTCSRCNSWIDLYERNPIDFLNGPKQRFRTWFLSFREKILAHLNANTGELYCLGYDAIAKRNLENIAYAEEAKKYETEPKLTKQEFAKFIQRNRKDV